jgi:hypothetical protein
VTREQGIAAVSLLAFITSGALGAWASVQKGGEGTALVFLFFAGVFFGIWIMHLSKAKQ